MIEWAVETVRARPRLLRWAAVVVLLGLCLGVLAGWFDIADIVTTVMLALVLAFVGWIAWRRYRRVFTDDLPRELPGGENDPAAARGLRRAATEARRDRAPGRPGWGD